jgi:hypothetical protein
MTDHATPDLPVTLSADGRARRDAMLGTLVGDMQRVHRGRRRRRRSVASVAIVLCAAAIAWPLLRPVRAPVGDLVARGVDAPAVPRPVVDYAVVNTTSGLTERLAARPPALVERVGDAGLIAALAAIDRPTGLIRRGDRVWLTDDVLGMEQ